MKLLPPPKPNSDKKQRPKQRKPRTGKGKLYVGGVPGNAGGGRPPNEFREWLREHILLNPKFRENLQRIAEIDLAQWGSRRADLALRAASLLLQLGSFAADRVEGRPMQPITVDSDAARREVLRAMTNEELIAHLHTVESAAAHVPEPDQSPA